MCNLQDSEVTNMAKWEYASIALIKIQRETGLTTDKQLLDKYGLEGWELVSVVPIQANNVLEVIAYLKREKSE
jgi:hypothetical protein